MFAGRRGSANCFRVLLGSVAILVFMYPFICKSLLIRRLAPTSRQEFFQNSMLICLRFISSSLNQDSFTVSYLINSLGLSPEAALLVSKNVSLKTRKKPDLVLEFFKNQGFSEVQICNLIRRLPKVLVSKPQKTLLPKLFFFRSKGLCSSEICKMFTGAPSIFKRSLEKQIIPAFDYLQDLLQSEEKTIASIKRFTCLLSYDLKTYGGPNIEILRQMGVPAPNIIKLFEYQPRTFFTRPDRFKEVVEEVKKMGFCPSRIKFIIAVYAMRTMSKATWTKKINTYKRWGLSEKEFYEAFGRHPLCASASEEKINGVMNLFVNQLGWPASLVVKRPVLISLSLKRRLAPRGFIVKALLSKGLLRKDRYLPVLFEIPENMFLEKFIMAFKTEASELQIQYEENLQLSKCSEQGKKIVQDD